MFLKLLSKETLELIRKAASKKPSPALNQLSYKFSGKRINSDKPTPVLELKLNEMRNSTQDLITQ